MLPPSSSTIELTLHPPQGGWGHLGTLVPHARGKVVEARLLLAESDKERYRRPRRSNAFATWRENQRHFGPQ